MRRKVRNITLIALIIVVLFIEKNTGWFRSYENHVFDFFSVPALYIVIEELVYDVTKFPYRKVVRISLSSAVLVSLILEVFQLNYWGTGWFSILNGTFDLIDITTILLGGVFWLLYVIWMQKVVRR